MDLEQLIPDTYVNNVFDINYVKLYNNDIKYAVFDVDCTILPFDDINVPDKLCQLFDYIKSVGITPGLYSSGSAKRVIPVSDALGVKYVSNAKKPFYGNFNSVNDNLFDGKALSQTTMMVGDSFYLDMIFAKRLGLYKVMVEPIQNGDKLKTAANDLVQTTVYTFLPKDKFQKGKYYQGIRG